MVKDLKKQKQVPLEFVKFYDNGQVLTTEISGEMGIRKASRDGKFIAIEGPERTLVVGMNKKNLQDPWCGFKDNQPVEESDFINLDMAFGVALSGKYIVSKDWNDSMKKGWIIIKNVDYDTSGEGYQISSCTDGSRLCLRRLDGIKKKTKQDKSVNM